MRDFPSIGTLQPDEYRRIREIFEAALERPPADRRAFLDRACDGNEELRAEVERMLAADAQTHALVDPGGRKAGSPHSLPAHCRSCGAAVTASHKFCPECGSPLAIDGVEGRFRAGALFANRFRIVAALGRGGMGEVYRAHDLELGQPVALKFLSAMRTDERARQRLRNEVRLARQLAHPNVCRVYDIGEAHGELYLSMEYVDGEDLASLLKRIGRLPVDKGVEIARKLCAGLAAAHAKGVLHRDFKPANIMIDGGGEVRVMDFGLAAVSSELDAKDIRSGTPAYMAPEQLAGREATVQSDLYALGLVLYELFTGKAPFDARDPNELQRQRESRPSTAPATLIPELGPRVERAILRCLEPDPKLRPATALEVSASLPGGDPLAEALAAGETPSPEMVAATGSNETMRPALAAGLLATALVSLGVLLWLTPKVQVLSRVPLEQGPEELRVRARDAIRALGYSTASADAESRFGYEGSARVEDVGTGPAPFYFSYEQSPSPLLRTLFGPNGLAFPYATATTGPGLVSVDVDLDGRLRRLVAIPAQTIAGDQQLRAPDWDVAFTAAGLNRSTFTPVATSRDVTMADTAVAWTGHFPSAPGTPVRIEGASLNGRITEFEVRFPWSGVRRRFSSPPLNRPTDLASLVNTALPIGLLFLAWLNWKQGRADVRSALRMGTYALAIVTGVALLSGASMVQAPAAAVIFTVTYLAVEPWARRMWAHAMVTWTRVLGGRFRDPLVGRDLLVVVACVTLDHAINRVIGWASGWSLPPGSEIPARFGLALETLLGGPMLMAAILAPFLSGIFVGMTWFAVLLLAKTLFKRTWLAAASYFLVFGIAIGASRVMEADWPGATLWCFELGFLLFLSLRFGLFAASLFSTLSLTINRSILTYDFAAWYGQGSLVATIILVTIAFYGFYASLGGRPLARLLAVGDAHRA
jgi:predicted Ser/Thr protein kinase